MNNLELTKELIKVTSDRQVNARDLRKGRLLGKNVGNYSTNSNI